jgi:hypothetical protein
MSYIDNNASSPSALLLVPAESDFFSQETEVGVVAEQTQHDEIGIEPIETMPGVRIIIRLRLVQPDEFLNLVLSLSGNVVSAEDDLDAPPVRVFRDLLIDKVFEMFRETSHEGRACGSDGRVSDRDRRRQRSSTRLTWRDTVRIESLFLGQDLSIPLGLFLSLLVLLGSPEPPAPLLVHLGPGCTSIDGHEEDLSRLDLGEQVVDVGIDGEDHLFLGDTKVHVALGGRRVRTVVNDPVHVEIEIVERRDGVRGDELGCEGVPLGNPSEEFRDTCVYKVSSSRLGRSPDGSLPMIIGYKVLL